MATVSHVGTLPDSSNKSDFYAIIDNATVTAIVNADCAAGMALADSKLAQITTASKVSGTALTGLASVPSGAGVLPAANGGAGSSNGVLKANGSGTVSAATAGTDYLKSGVACAAGDIYTDAFADYSASSTVTGWASFTSKQIYKKKIGKTIFVTFFISGTSNSENTSFTLPDALSGAGVYTVCQATDNGGTPVAGLVAFQSSTAAIYKDMAASTWTNSGTKTVGGQFFYETA